MRSNSLNTSSGFHCKLKVLFVSLYLGGIFPFNLYASGICDRSPAVIPRIIEALINEKVVNEETLRSTGIFKRRRRMCEKITEEQLQKIKSLNLDRNYIDYNMISKKDFAGLINLEVLNLRSNRFRYLTTEIFSDLTNLKSIDLSHNHLTFLPEGFLSPYPNLEGIDLSYK